MAIAFDNAATAQGQTVNSVQWTHTAGGANTYIYVGACIFNQTSISNVAYNAVSLTKKGIVVASESGELWSLVGNNTGALTMSAVLVGVSTDSLALGSVSYTGVSQGAPDGQVGSATATATDLKLSLSTQSGGLCIGITGNGSNSTWTDPATQTRRFLVSTSTIVALVGSEKATSGAGSTSMSWSLAAAANTFLIGLYLSATAAAGGSPVLFTLSMLGVGS